MLAIQSSKSTQKCTPNLLPARISHSGPVNDTERYWKPERDDKDKLHAYFRGRHLHGTTLSLPSHYTGTVLHITEKDVPSSTDTTTGNNSIEEEDEENENIETKVADKAAEFDEVVIWGHGGPVDESEDVYVRGMREWIGFAEAMHGGGDDDEEMAEGQSKKRS